MFGQKRKERRKKETSEPSVLLAVKATFVTCYWRVLSGFSIVVSTGACVQHVNLESACQDTGHHSRALVTPRCHDLPHEIRISKYACAGWQEQASADKMEWLA